MAEENMLSPESASVEDVFGPRQIPEQKETEPATPGVSQKDWNEIVAGTYQAPEAVKRFVEKEKQATEWMGPLAGVYETIKSADPAANIPLVSWAARAATAAGEAGLGGGEGETFGERYKNIRAQQEAERAWRRSQYPISSVVGDIGSIAVLPTFGAERLGPYLVGKLGPSLAGGKIQSAVRTAGDIAGGTALAGGYGAAAGLEQGNTLGEKLKSAVESGKEAAAYGPEIFGYQIPLTVGLPIGGSIVSKALELVRSKGTSDPAARAVIDSLLKDAALRQELRQEGVAPGIGAGMTQAEKTAAEAAGQPWVIGDIGGEQTRTLARTMANISPEATAIMQQPLSQRFTTQAARFGDYLKSMFGRGVDAASTLDALKTQARAENKPRYDAAYEHPNAQAMWGPEYSELMASPAIQSAIGNAERLGKDYAVASRTKPVENPFVKDEQGNWKLRQNPDGSVAVPNLQFWDQVKQSLDGQINAAYRAGDNSVAKSLSGVRDRLKNTLDTSVPNYEEARSGAAKFFKAEDAHDAGMSFMKNMNDFDYGETKKALEKMSPTERQLFSLGMASDISGRARNLSDVSNITRMFDSPAKHEKLVLGLGENTADAIEGYMRRENMMNMFRNAVSGNSTTTKQLIAAALGTGAAGQYAWEHKNEIMQHPVKAAGAALTALTTAAIVAHNRGMQQKLAPEIARLLVSSKPEDLNRLSQAMARRPDIREAVRNAEKGVAAAIGSAVGAPTEESLEGQAQGGRIERASGGRVTNHAAAADKLIAAAERAKKSQSKTTEPLLDHSDDTIATALEIANKHI